VYLVTLEQVAHRKYMVNFQYGRRGTSPNEGTKTDKPVDYYTARDLYLKLVESKLDKGYEVTAGDSSPPYAESIQVSPTAKANREREGRAAGILTSYAMQVGCKTAEDRQYVLRDLLADLMHWAQQRAPGHFGQQLQAAMRHYDEEVQCERLEKGLV
jgi:predicted DNA-binding WGR domain protein